MRNVLSIVIIFLLLSCKAQTIAIEDFQDYVKQNKHGLLNGGYIKDVNNVLDKFVGTWKGTQNSKNYEFVIVKVTKNDGVLKEDKLLMRYKITDSNGVIIAKCRSGIIESFPQHYHGIFTEV